MHHLWVAGQHPNPNVLMYGKPLEDPFFSGLPLAMQPSWWIMSTGWVQCGWLLLLLLPGPSIMLALPRFGNSILHVHATRHYEI